MGTTQIKRAGDKKMKSVKRADAISAVELLGLMGFAFLLAWMFVSFSDCSGIFHLMCPLRCAI